MSLIIVDRSREVGATLCGAARSLRLGSARDVCDARGALECLRRGGVRAIIAELELGTDWLATLESRSEWSAVAIVLTCSDPVLRRPARADALLRRPFHVSALPRALDRAYRHRMARRRRLVLLSSGGVWRPRGWETAQV